LVFIWAWAFSFLGAVSAQDFGWTGTNSLEMPSVGAHQLRVLTPTMLELSLVTTKKDEKGRVNAWDFVGENFALQLPPVNELEVQVNGNQAVVKRLGFKRRPIYAPLKKRDLRILSQIYLELETPVELGAEVLVNNPGGKLWDKDVVYKSKAEALRFNPAIHVNQVGYQINFPKQAMVGYYIGSLGEMQIPVQQGFELVEAGSGKSVYKGTLQLRADRGFTYSPLPYQLVYQADFTQFNTPGVYRLSVPGMGASYPFQINEGTLGVFARTYALGLYHQRCGTSNTLPFTRFVHDACHVALAEVPDLKFKRAQEIIAGETGPVKDDPLNKAPILKNTEASLYPYIRTGKVDVSGGHHDAGDYSKYTINSAALIHYLVFSADNFDGAGALDNLGLPESGDGKSDLLEEAKWEADFLVKMQDNDGGFYFLVYPKERQYEDNVLPDKSDPQIVWPKNTAATAAATAALAEIGSSPLFRKQFPQVAEVYMTKALRGWAFLERALARYGNEGSYQVLTHYGNEFRHNDELAWAAAALYAATGKKEFEKKLIEGFNPEDRNTRRWSWWPMFEAYGCAVRTYVFAARNGKLKASEVDAPFLTRCESLIHETAQNQVRFARDTAYGTSFPDPNKANKNAGWYFSSERAFDITVAWQLRKEEPLREAVLSNLNYEAGCNPVNVAYITGLGWRRQREIVHQYAQNDNRVLPPSGLPLGNIQAGFAYLDPYKKELGEVPYPPDGAATAPYPFYDRWGDSFNTSTEFVIVDQARSLGSLAYWMAQTATKKQSWKAATAQIIGLPKSAAVGEKLKVSLVTSLSEPDSAQIVWEARDQEPVMGRNFVFAPINVGEQWVEMEGMWPDGRRIFARTSFMASASMNVRPNSDLSAALEVTKDMGALYHLDGNLKDATGKAGDLKLRGKASFDPSNLSWMVSREGSALRFKDVGDKATNSITVPGGVARVQIEAMIYLNDYKAYNRANARILSLNEDWNSSLEFGENMYEGPMIRGGTVLSLKKEIVNKSLTPRTWHHLEMSLGAEGYEVKVDGKLIGSAKKTEIGNWGHRPAVLELGDFDGYIDEVAVRWSGP
jgi:hypothetical protein